MHRFVAPQLHTCALAVEFQYLRGETTPVYGCFSVDASSVVSQFETLKQFKLNVSGKDFALLWTFKEVDAETLEAYVAGLDYFITQGCVELCLPPTLGKRVNIYCDNSQPTLEIGEEDRLRFACDDLNVI